MISNSQQIFEYIDRIFKSVNFIEKNLFQTFQIEDLAKMACYSPFHFQRVFKEITGIGAIEYVRKRKLTIAAHSILSQSEKVSKIGNLLGFETQSSFGRAFKSQYGMSPLVYKNTGIDFWYLDTPILMESQLEYMNTGGVSLEPKIEYQAHKIMYGLPFEQYSDQKTNREKRNLLRNMFESEHIKLDKIFQVEFSSDTDVLNGIARGYVGVEIAKGQIPSDILKQLVHFEIPASCVARFNRRVTDDYWAQRYIFENWVRKTEHTPTFQNVCYEKEVGNAFNSTDIISIPIRLRNVSINSLRFCVN